MFGSLRNMTREGVMNSYEAVATWEVDQESDDTELSV